MHDKTPGTPSEVQESCDQYVNWSSFIARCTGAGILSAYEKYSAVDMDEALKKELPRGYLRNCRILAAANYIIYAGQAIEESNHSFPPGSESERKALDMWNMWKGKFKDIADGQDEDPEIKDVARKAHMMMVELESLEHDAAEGSS